MKILKIIIGSAFLLCFFCSLYQINCLKSEKAALQESFNQTMERLAKQENWMQEMGLPLDPQMEKFEQGSINPQTSEQENLPPDSQIEEQSNGSSNQEEFSIASNEKNLPYNETFTKLGFSKEDAEYYFPAGLDPLIDSYLKWKDKYPEGYAKLEKWGKAFLQGDEANYPPLKIDPAMYEACIIAYDGKRFDGALQMWKRTNSPYYGKGVETVKYLRCRGRDWFTAVTIMEFESTCATNPRARNDFGVCDPTIDMSHDLKGYCDYLDKWQMETFGYTSNDLTKIMMVYNDHAWYRQNFYSTAGGLANWWP